MKLIAQHEYATGRTRWVTIVEYISGAPYVTVAQTYGQNRGRQYEAPMSELAYFYKDD